MAWFRRRRSARRAGRALFGKIGSSVTYAAQKVDQAVGVVATAALTGQVVEMESASGVQIAGAFGGGLQTGGKAVLVA